MKRRQPLARHQPLPTRQAPLRRQSLAQARQGAKQRRAYGAAPDAEQEHCSVCGRWSEGGKYLEHSHHYTQKAHPEHRNNPLNWQRQCRPCHAIWENNKAYFARRYPDAWRMILSRMQALDPVAYEQFRLKNPY